MKNVPDLTAFVAADTLPTRLGGNRPVDEKYLTDKSGAQLALNRSSYKHTRCVDISRSGWLLERRTICVCRGLTVLAYRRVVTISAAFEQQCTGGWLVYTIYIAQHALIRQPECWWGTYL